MLLERQPRIDAKPAWLEDAWFVGRGCPQAMVADRGLLTDPRIAAELVPLEPCGDRLPAFEPASPAFALHRTNRPP